MFNLFKRPQNKRKFLRLKTHHLVKYGQDNQEKRICFARNISAGGLLLHTKEDLSRDKEVEITINFPGSPKELIVIGKVVHSKALRNIGGYDIGVQFSNIEKDVEKFLNEAIERTVKVKRSAFKKKLR